MLSILLSVDTVIGQVQLTGKVGISIHFANTHLINKMYDIYIQPFDIVYMKQKGNSKLLQAEVIYTII